MAETTERAPYGTWLLALSAIVGFGIAVYDDFDTANGIHGSYGVWLVMVTTALLALAALAVAIWPRMARWLRGLLLALILLDIVGTGFAAYMLETWWLVGAMAAALLFWIVHLIVDPAPVPRHVTEPARA